MLDKVLIEEDLLNTRLLVQCTNLTLGNRVVAQFQTEGADYVREIDSLPYSTKNQTVPSTDSAK